MKYNLDKSGYMVRYKNGKAVFEHREKMEKKLKRKLKSNEHVHHKNAIKSDNRYINLVVLSHSDHSKLSWQNGRKTDKV